MQIPYDNMVNETPAYVFDLDSLKQRVKMIKRELGEARLCYAMKANPFLVGPLKNLVDRFEVCSPGEYEICKKLNVDSGCIVVSGVNKIYDSMRRVFEQGKGEEIFTLESPRHYEILNDLCAEYGYQIKVLVRYTSGNQFGMDKATCMDVMQKVLENDRMELQGIHYYSGTQKKMKKVEKELLKLGQFSSEFAEQSRCELKELEYGPGLAVTYFENEQDMDSVDELRALRGLLAQRQGYEQVTIELGRFVAAECGSFVTKVVDTKITDENRVAILDGGTHHLNYYGQMLGMKIPHIQVLPEKQVLDEHWNLYGSLCTVADVITRDAKLGNLAIDDVLIFKRCGAYSVTEGMSLFLSRDLPKVMFYSKEEGFRTVRDTVETYILNSEGEEG